MTRAESATRTETRRLAAVMFTDMVGFSRLMHADEDHALRLLDACNAMLSEVVGEHGGRVLKKMGDAILADFSSAATAVTCAVQIQTRLRDRNAEKPPNEQIVLRIGIHLGDMIIRGDDLYGDGVNVAARLEPLCEPGGICLSEAVYQAIGANPSVQPIRVGEVELKNILQKQVIYRIPSLYGGDAGEGETPFGRRALALGAVDRIDVLPPPSRGPASALLWSVVLSFVCVIGGIWTGAVFGRDTYRIWDWEVNEPGAIVGALRAHSSPAHLQIWESLDRNAREAIDAYDGSAADTRAAGRSFRRIRGALNDLIGAERPVLELAASSGGADTEALSGDDLRRLNRELIESAFPGAIRRYVNEPTTSRVLGNALSVLWFEERALLIAALAILLALEASGAYFIVLKTLRISFRDIRDVDALLDYYIQDLGFKPPERKGDDLVFRATLWTLLTYNIFRLRARVAGNTVLLTGPAPMMRRLRKRMLLLANA